MFLAYISSVLEFSSSFVWWPSCCCWCGACQEYYYSLPYHLLLGELILRVLIIYVEEMFLFSFGMKELMGKDADL